jgi:transposase
MLYVGIDVHWDRTTVVILDENGKKFKVFTVRGGWRLVAAELRKLRKKFVVCYEASTGYGVLYDMLIMLAERVVVAHPGRLRMIYRSKRKSDRVDAGKLAKLLYMDCVPQVHVPSADVRSWRSLINHRSRMVDERARAKCQVRALLRGLEIRGPRSLWSRAGREWLESLEFDSELDALRRDELVQRIAHHDRMIRRVTKALDKVAKNNAGVALLMTIPGVGARTAESVMAWIDTIKRFSSVREVAAYFGIVTSVDSSADRTRYGHITRQGPSVVRKYLVEAAWQGIRRSPTIGSYYARIARNDKERKKVALVATAHYLVRVMAAMLRTGEVWRQEAA